MSQAIAEDLLNNWDTIEAAFNQNGFALDDGFWSMQDFDNANAYLEALEDWLKRRSELDDVEAIGLEKLAKIQSHANSVENDFLSGNLTAENALTNENYNALYSEAEQLAQLYPELRSAADAFREESIIGSEMWTAALHQLQKKINELTLDAFIQDAEAASDEVEKMLTDSTNIEATLQSEEFQSALDDLLDKNYTIDVEIHAQAEQAFESFSTAAEQMRTMASKIGEGYVVAASDIRELNNIFPGIIQGMQDVGDGSVKLNEQIVQNAMNSANAEVQASAYSTIEQLENQATILRSKQSTYMAMYEAALALAKGEGDAEENTQKIKQGLLDIEALNNQEMTDTKQENAEAVATDSNVQAGIMAQNWDSAYQSAAQSAIEFAKVAVSAAKSAQTGELQVVSGDFGVTYTGRNGQSSEAAKLAELQDAVANASTEDDYAALAQSFLEAAEAAGMKANDIEGMIDTCPVRSSLVRDLIYKCVGVQPRE